ncbi:hypothetical protein [Paludisphaera borealis]|uniref:HEPN domain-containing protein n=1 Tax=Paludisphaera borealis TaxID=1387353 RepID=A0A1U7CXE3_9BACT|nr:hypothetical protein [Paludisphaera borealis]APW63568.1 hypothetical protein BSF38_05140 [Paludisphaera borealis]
MQEDRAESGPPAPGRQRGGALSETDPIETGGDPGWVVETVVSPFHCLYQDALHFHTQSRLAFSEAEASRLARAALMLYIAAAEALVRQAAVELGRPELRGLLADPSRPLPLAEAWRLLPSIISEPGTPTRPFSPEAPPWPQFTELLMLETSWVYPGHPSTRRAYYRSSRRDGDYEPLEPHQIPPPLRRTLRTESLHYPRTGLPRDPYALRPRHLDTARGVLDAAIEALDRRMGGVLCQGQRHRREPTQVVNPPANGNSV